MPDWLLASWQWLSGAAVLLADAAAVAHIVLTKRDTRAAIGWAGLVLFAPLFGSVLYYLLGINRIARRAKRLKRHRPAEHPGAAGAAAAEHPPLPPAAAHLAPLARLVGELTRRPLLGGNAVRPFADGTAAYAAMLDAIDRAERSVALATYIFDTGAVGDRFVDALGRAVGRGVEVRVLIDAIGARYSWPRAIVGRLKAAGIPVARFLPAFPPWFFTYANLRCHRKLLVVDGAVGFTGGMNIRDGHDPTTHPRHPIADRHFRLDGPVVADLRACFADDWRFAAGEQLGGDRWFPKLEPAGGVPARGVRGGPDHDIATLRTVYLGAIASARESVRVVSPYFLPESDLQAGLAVAALRGVRVDIVLPAENNLRLVQWACQGQLGAVLDPGCRVWLTPPPFDHSKLLVVDRAWVLFGSSNWDPRSLRLNFEFDVECYDPEFAAAMDDVAAAKIASARELTAAEHRGRTLPVRLRDGVARLLTPYL
jgi:cardiolipin synthase